jgi:hypothetical protein
MLPAFGKSLLTIEITRLCVVGKDPAETCPKQKGPGQTWPGPQYQRHASGSIRLAAEESRDLELIVVVGISRVMHSRQWTTVLIKPLRGTAFRVFRHRLAT